MEGGREGRTFGVLPVSLSISRTLWFVLPEQVALTLALTMACEQYVVNIFCALKYSKGDL